MRRFPAGLRRIGIIQPDTSRLQPRGALRCVAADEGGGTLTVAGKDDHGDAVELWVECERFDEVVAGRERERVCAAVADVADLFRRLTAGVYVVGVAEGQRRNAFTAAWLMQVSFDPLLLALSINPGHASYPLLVGGGGFTVSVLSRDQLHLARHFGTRCARETDKLAGIAWHPGRTGAPILTEALAYFECRITQRVRAGDHEIVVARPVAGEILLPDAIPLTYADAGDLDGSRELYPPSL